jgi:IclR family KDG regulon transcriptional repressor
MKNTEKKNNNTPGPLEKTFSILESLSEKEEMSLDDITKSTGFKKPTVFRVLSQLATMGYIEKSKNNYCLGLKLFAISKKAFQIKNNVKDIAETYMNNLQNTYDETVNLALREEQNCILVATKPSKKVFRVEETVGEKFPLHRTAIGKVVAAHLTWESVEKVLKNDGMERNTENTITDIEAYRKEIRVVKEQGYAEDREESYIGVSCIAVPIFNSKNIIYGALGIASPANRITDEIASQMRKDLQIFGYRISFELSLSDIF